jgi:hypothetical protein
VMKKAVWVVTLALLAGAIVIFTVKTFVVESATAQMEISERTAQILQAKIDAIRKAEKATEPRASVTVEVTEAELESYVLHSLREQIPAKVDSMDVQLAPGSVAADTRMTFGNSPTRNPLIDVLISGTHRLFVKGKLAASGGKGKFTLEEARVDGIPVPIILIETLVDRYVKPKYPDVKLDQPFAMPWGIEDLTISNGKATIVY